MTTRQLNSQLLLSFIFGTLLLLPHANAVPLTGMGDHLPLPLDVDENIIPIPPVEIRAAVTSGNISFSGSWSPAVAPPWRIGSFQATGPVPAGNTATGLTVYDFALLGPNGLLPKDTFFIPNDIDLGAQANETLTFRAWDSGGSLITGPWLSEPVGVGFQASTANPIGPGNDMPSWTYANGVYSFSGDTVGPNNPSLGFAMLNDRPLSQLEVNRNRTTLNSYLYAPINTVPEPSTHALILLIGILICWRNKQLRSCR